MRPFTVLAGAVEGCVPALLTGHSRQAPFDFLQGSGQRLLEGDIGGPALGIGQVDGGAAAWIIQQWQAERRADPGEVRGAGYRVSQSEAGAAQRGPHRQLGEKLAERTSGGEGKSVSVPVGLGGSRLTKQKTTPTTTKPTSP